MSVELGNLNSWGTSFPNPSTVEFPVKSLDIYDSIHGYVTLEKEERFLLDLPPVQRLRFISQLGLANFVYPGANHTRFEHSIGVFCLVKKILKEIEKKRIPNIELDDRKIRSVAFAALLHDIGHFPFSHVTEILLRDNFQDMDHETLSSQIVKTKYMKAAFDIIKDKLHAEIDMNVISDFIVGKGKEEELFLANIVKGLIDADRMDYLVRDAYYTGIPFGKVDLDRLVKTLIPFKERNSWILAIDEKGKSAVESLIVGRTLMHNSVYYHHTKRVAEAMLTRAVYKLIRGKETLLNLLNLDDNLLFSKLLNSEGSSKIIARRLVCRDLLKRTLTINFSQASNKRALDDFTDRKKNPLTVIIEKEEQLCNKLGLADCEVIIDFPPIPKTKEVDFPVAINDKYYKPLEEMSHLVKAAQDQRRDDWVAYVFCSDKKTKGTIKKYFEDEFDLNMQ